MRIGVPILLSSIVLCYVSIAQAVFADEAYLADYHLPFLGLPQAHTTIFHRPSAASKASLLYTLSDRLVLGAVNPKDGAVIWRQLLDFQALNATKLGLLKAPEGGDSLISAVDGKLQTWDATDGRLLWEWRTSGRIKSIDTTASGGEGHDVLALSEEGPNSVVRRLAAETSAVVWQHLDARYRLAMIKRPSDFADFLQWGCALLLGLL